MAQQLTKAELIVVSSLTGDEKFKLPLHLNPNQISVSRGLKVVQEANVSASRRHTRLAAIEPVKVKLPKLIFDTYHPHSGRRSNEHRTSVRRTIDQLEDALVDELDSNLHFNLVYFNWGTFTDSKHIADYCFIIRKLDVDYTLFLPDGTPVRAEVDLTLEQYHDGKTGEKVSPPGHDAALHTVRAGETAQSIANKTYGDPTAWRAICDANQISDPMSISPGTVLKVPPKPQAGGGRVPPWMRWQQRAMR